MKIDVDLQLLTSFYVTQTLHKSDSHQDIRKFQPCMTSE